MDICVKIEENPSQCVFEISQSELETLSWEGLAANPNPKPSILWS